MVHRADIHIMFNLSVRRNRGIHDVNINAPLCQEVLWFIDSFQRTVLFHNDFPYISWLMSYNSQLLVAWQYFTNIVAIQNVGVLQQILLYEIIGVCY